MGGPTVVKFCFANSKRRAKHFSTEKLKEYTKFQSSGKYQLSKFHPMHMIQRQPDSLAKACYVHLIYLDLLYSPRHHCCF